MTVKLREDYQVPTVDDFIDYLVSGKGLTPLTALPTGCHGWDTPIRMYDHSVKMVQDVVVGDLLRGDDGKPRKVLELYRGRDHLFKVGQSHGASYVVNSVHVLVTLGEGNAIIEQPVTTMMRDAHNWKGSTSTKRVVPQQYTPPLFGTDEVELTEDSCELDILRADPPSRAKLVASVLRDRKLRGSNVLTLFCHNQDEMERFTILFRAEGYGTRVQQMPLGSGKQVLLELHGEGTTLPDALGRYIEERNLSSFEYMGMGEYYGFNIDGNQRYRLGDLTITHNTGKSLVMAGGIQRLRQMWAARVLVLTHVKELVEQDARAIALLNKEPIGINCNKLKRRDFRQPIIVGTVGSVSSMIDKIGKVHTLIVDESHRISNNNETQYRKIIAALKEQCPNMVVWGLTATAYRNGQGLLTDGENALFDGFATDLTQGDKFTWFIDQGYLVDVIPRAVTNELDVSGVGTNSSGEFMESQLISAIDREDVTKAALAEAAPSIIKAYACMIFAVGKHHANTIQEILLRDYGVASVVVLGDTDDNERTEAFSMFKTGRVNVLINCGVATTGFDYPEVDLLVVLRATRSASLYTQIAGRAMRPVYEKGYDLLTQEGRLAAIAASRKGKAAVMLDFGGNAKRLGEVNNIRLPLPKSARKSGANEPPPGKECPTCHAIVASNTRICRHCNHEFPLTTLKDKSDGSSIIKRGDTTPVEYKAKEVVHVKYASYMKHTGADGLDSLKVVYTTTNGRVITEFLSWYKAVGMTRGWWSDVGATGVGLPASVQDALSHAANLKVPFGLAIVKNGKYTNVNQRLMNAGQLDSFVKREKDKERDSSKAARTIGIPTLF